MASAPAANNFVDWLGNKLKSLNTDESVFGSYITGILDCDDPIEEKTEALQAILSEIVEAENDIARLCEEIVEAHQQHRSERRRPSPPAASAAAASGGEDVDVKLARMLESRCLAATERRQYTAEERKIREAILSQYSQMTDDEDDGNDVGGGGGGAGHHHHHPHGGGGLERNTNAQSVQQAERERREQAKVDSQRKKEKDKEDREKQKHMKEEKKEKRKTVKGERRR